MIKLKIKLPIVSKPSLSECEAYSNFEICLMIKPKLLYLNKIILNLLVLILKYGIFNKILNCFFKKIANFFKFKIAA